MKAKGGTWTFGELYAFLTNPRGYIPGTNMTFAGLSRGQQRADVIDFLHTLSDKSAAAAEGGGECAGCCRSASWPSRQRRPRRRRNRTRSPICVDERPGIARPFSLEGRFRRGTGKPT